MFHRDSAERDIRRPSRPSGSVAARMGAARAVGIAAFIHLCGASAGCGSLVVDPGEGVGDPCVPSAEYDVRFAGFKTNELSLETGTPDCRTGVCLINHFQGRVSCAGGQSAPLTCENDSACPTDTTCTAGLCLDPTAAAGCLTPGTSRPVQTSVCGQCSARQAADAVYCSCRCGLAEGQPAEGVSDFCRCPAGYRCEEVRPYLGWLDPDAGKYCVKEGTQWDGTDSCGSVTGYWDPRCGGTPASGQ